MAGVKHFYRFDSRAWARLQRELLGKTLLFTGNDDWSDAEIVRAFLLLGTPFAG